ncbi:hypothetical protein GCM10009853_091440 [Glycomyces scopariae]|uniref:YbaB/EbfC DNA-binding family protein n=1 Tax=Glycomyces sambucus TaxID=380244 RepID=A0A1G9FIC9_9ACTN|nr:hypothetical protein [Glycomyces sambucus]SDK88150.1 hypothetical protein SAMN05216298_1814 [Glycomyces sambucus]
MTDAPFRERSLTSACGNVTVTVAAGAAPRVELAAATERMFTRDLAELVTATAREAAHAAMEDALAEGSGPDIGEAIDALTEFTAGIRERGFAAVIAERAAALEDEAAEEEQRPSVPERPFQGAGLSLDPAGLAALDAALDMWKRFQATPPGTGKGEEPGPVGRAKSESKLVTVEATLEFPLAEVILSKRALEIGAKALSAEITETAAAAVADLDAKQSAYLTGLGLPVGPDEAKAAVGEAETVSRDGVGLVTDLRAQQDRIGGMFREGGHFA